MTHFITNEMRRFCVTSLSVAAGGLIAVVALSVYTPTAEAQTTTPANQALTYEQLTVDAENDFVIGPGKQEVSLQPGESTTRTIRVTNRREQSMTFAVEVEDFTAAESSEETVTLLGDETGPRSLQDLLSPAAQEFTLEFGEQVEIPVEISVPEDAEPGGRYGAVIVSNAPSQEVQQNQGAATVVSRLASLFLVRVDGETEEAGQLTDFRTAGSGSVFFEDGPSEFELLFENTGNVHLAPYGQIDITNIFGQRVATLPVDAYFALPDSTRYRSVSWDPGFLLGYYNAELSLNRSYGNTIDTDSLSFWVIPWRILLIAFVALMLLIGAIRFFTKRFELRRKSPSRK